MSNSPFEFNPGNGQEHSGPMRSPFGLEGTAPAGSSDEGFRALFEGTSAEQHAPEVEQGHNDAISYSSVPVALPSKMAWTATFLGVFMVISGLLFGRPVDAIGNMVILGIGATLFALGLHGLLVRRHELSQRSVRRGLIGVSALDCFLVRFLPAEHH